MKGFIKQLLRETLIEEDFDTHDELQRLANDMYKLIIRKYVEKAIQTESSNFRPPIIINAFNELSSKYSKLNEFMNTQRLQIGIRDKDYRSKGDFSKTGPYTSIINIRLDLEPLKQVLHKFVVENIGGYEYNDEGAKQMMSNVYVTVYDKNIASTLLHELQHAYDSWRSNDKYTNSRKSRDFFKQYGNETGLDSLAYDRYLKMQHEINARFAQAIKDTTFFVYNFKTDETKPMNAKIMNNIKTVIDDFKQQFLGYDDMTPKVRERLLNRLIKIYDEQKDKIEKEA